MSTTKFLKAKYERHPEWWTIERFSGACWVPLKAPKDCLWLQRTRYRLRPVIPAGLGLIPSEAFAYGPDDPGAVFLQGPLERPSGVPYFLGWHYYCRYWRAGSYHAGDQNWPYLISFKDQNAEEIIELNRAQYQPENMAKPRDPTGDLIENLISIVGVERFSNAMKERGWTFSGESDRLRLDECEFECQDPPGVGAWFHDPTDPDRGLLYALRHGPSAVRVRRKR